jgi:hypothetical protein
VSAPEKNNDDEPAAAVTTSIAIYAGVGLVTIVGIAVVGYLWYRRRQQRDDVFLPGLRFPMAENHEFKQH